MRIDTSVYGCFQCITIEEDIRIIADLTDLKFLIEGYLSKQKKHIALSFSDASYIFSGAISVVIECYKKIREMDGELYIIESNDELISILKYLKIDSLIPIINKRDALPQSVDKEI